MAVVVADNAFDVLVGQQFREPLGNHNRAVLLAFLFTGQHGLHDPRDNLLNVHCPAGCLLARLGIDERLADFVLAGDVLDANHEAGLAGDGRAVGEPAGDAAHRLGDVVLRIASASANRLRISPAITSTAVK